MGYNDEAVLKTLSYSDIFDFPLTKEELWKFLISDKKITSKDFENSLQKLIGKKISYKKNYLCLKNREKIIDRRVSNAKSLDGKLQLARKTCRYLSLIPSILFIGLSGSLAVGDAQPKDDIDFFIITKKGRLYETRFWILMILQFLGLRRSRADKNAANKVCVNFLIDETNIYFPKNKQDLYIAHEISQLKPLFERDRIYSEFIKSNKWVEKFLPNINFQKPWKSVKSNSLTGNFLTLEAFFRKVQIVYMGKLRNPKSVTKQAMVFHPNDYRVQVLKQMKLKMQELGLLTKF